MNERIKELAEQAGFKILTDGRIIPTLDHNGECGRDLQKFAELIVRESMKVTKDYTCNQGWDYSAPVALARHFGVEE